MDYSIENGLDTDLFITDINYKELNGYVTDKPLFLGTHNGLHKIDFTATSKLYKRELLYGIEFIPKIQFEDYPHTFDVLLRSHRITILNETLYLYTNNPDSISNQKDSLKQIQSYHVGVLHVCNTFRSNNNNFEMMFLKRKFIPDILRQQLYKCRNADGG